MAPGGDERFLRCRDPRIYNRIALFATQILRLFPHTHTLTLPVCVCHFQFKKLQLWPSHHLRLHLGGPEHGQCDLWELHTRSEVKYLLSSCGQNAGRNYSILSLSGEVIYSDAQRSTAQKSSWGEGARSVKKKNEKVQVTKTDGGNRAEKSQLLAWLSLSNKEPNWAAEAVCPGMQLEPQTSA